MSTFVYSDADYEKAQSYLEGKGWNFLGKGRHRATFGKKGKKVVIKVPCNLKGMYANQSEAKIFQEFKSGPDFRGAYLARCRQFRFRSLPLLMMERVRFPAIVEGSSAYSNHMPDMSYTCALEKRIPWAIEIDCAQIGKTAKGKLVAFDYSHPHYYPEEAGVFNDLFEAWDDSWESSIDYWED